MESLIVRIESRKEWEKVAKKAISLGYIWNGGETTSMTKDMYDEFGLIEKKDIFLFLYGDDAINNASTGHKGILVWGTFVEDTKYWVVEKKKLPVLSAKEFLK